MKILTLNAGSGSDKAALFDLSGEAPLEAPAAPLWRAEIDWVPHGGGAELKVRAASGAERRNILRLESRAEGLSQMLMALWDGEAGAIGGPGDIAAVGHRVVHGGRKFAEGARITPEVREEIKRLVPLAPLHNPVALEGMAVVDQRFGNVPQVAVFDTAFHTTLPDAAAAYAGPYTWFEEGLRRYGFHGISHEYVSRRAAHLLGQDVGDLKLITCHLGNGCSLAAVRGGRSVDTTMGFTPLDGLMMAKRAGSVDPGLLIYLMRERGLTVDDLDRILNQESGLLGVSGVSADLREVVAACDRGDARARLAYDMFVHSLRRHVGAMLGSLGGCDALVFTGGIGENSARVRADACEPFRFFGLQIDAAGNTDVKGDADISAAAAQVRVLVVQSQENWAVAQECRRILEAWS